MGLRVERERLVAAIRLGEAKLKEMAEAAIARGTCACCVGASYGGTTGPYDMLQKKQKLRRDRLGQIDQKLGAA